MPDESMLVTLGGLKARFPEQSHTAVAIVSVSHQELRLYQRDRLVETYPVSTSKYGAGNKDGSYMTPLGVHRIREKIGGDALLGTIFKARKDTHQVAQVVTDAVKTPNDYITTRILWLDGLETGVNQGDGIDSYARYIYIHGTHEEGLIGQPVSFGCIRMINRDVIELYDQMREGDLVVIVE
jgi:lipoprotein-anchoring transpeptidase ErfK/SrfK